MDVVGVRRSRARASASSAASAGYTKYGMDVQEDALRAGARPGHPGWGEDAPEHYGTLGADDALERVTTERGAYQDFYAAVARAIRRRRGPPGRSERRR